MLLWLYCIETCFRHTYQIFFIAKYCLILDTLKNMYLADMYRQCDRLILKIRYWKKLYHIGICKVFDWLNTLYSCFLITKVFIYEYFKYMSNRLSCQNVFNVSIFVTWKSHILDVLGNEEHAIVRVFKHESGVRLICF